MSRALTAASPLVVALVITSAAAAEPGPIVADRMIWTRSGGIVDGPAENASLNHPIGLVMDAAGNIVFSDLGSNVIRRFDAASGRIQTLAGDGIGGYAGDGGPFQQARFHWPIALAMDARGIIYVSDMVNLRIRALNPTASPVVVATVTVAPGAIETIAGNGEESDFFAGPPENVPALESPMLYPRGLTVAPNGDIYFCDIDGLRVRVVHADTGIIETYAGRGWPGSDDLLGYPGDHGEGGLARDMILSFPSAVAFGPGGDLFIAEWAGNASVIWRVDADDTTVHAYAGNGVDALGGDGGDALLGGLRGNVQSMVFDGAGNLLIADTTAIRRVDTQHILDTIAGIPEDFITIFSASDDDGPALGAVITEVGHLALHDGSIYFPDQSGGVLRRVDADGTLRAVVRARTGIKQPFSAAIDRADRLFVAEWAHGRIRRVDPDGRLETAVNVPDNGGDAGAGGLAARAQSGPSNGIALDEQGNLFFTDVTGSRVLEVLATTGQGGVLVHQDSRIIEVARFPLPFDAILDHLAVGGGKVYVSEFITGAIWVVDIASGDMRILAGPEQGLNVPTGLVRSSAGVLYAADTDNGRVVRVDTGSGAVTPVASVPYRGSNAHLALLGEDLLFVGNDYRSDQVWVIDLAASEPTAEEYAGVPQFFGHYFAGDGGPARAAFLATAEGIAVDRSGKLLIVERDSARTRVVGTTDILPDVFPNVIHASGSAAVPVAIESNPELDATALDPASVSVAGAAVVRGSDGRPRSTIADVNGDGRRDLVVYVREGDVAAGLAAGAREAVIAAQGPGGKPFHDADWVKVVD